MKGKQRRPRRMPKKGARVPSNTVQIFLSVDHHVNGVKHGPGHVTVSRDLADLLLEQERNFHEHERHLKEERAFMIGARGTKMQVPYDSFNDVWTNPSAAFGFTTVNGRNPNAGA